MFGFSLLIIIAAALVGTGLTALGLRIFFRIIEPTSVAVQIASPEEI